MIKVILRAGAAVILTLVVIWIITQVFIFLFPGYTIPIFSLHNALVNLSDGWAAIAILIMVIGFVATIGIIGATFGSDSR